MKKIFLIILSVFLMTGCSIFKDNLDGATIYTTTYPLEFLISTLYGNYATIESIYPADVDTTTYKLTDKQTKEYASADLFIYNGLSNEKNIAKNLLNKNNKLLIIDVSYGLSYTNGIEELWMSPNNYLMLAKNIRDNLNEELTSRTIMESINAKYDDFAEKISMMDADLRTIGKEATEKGQNTLVVTDDVFKYLENYGFNVISLDEDTVTDGIISSVSSAYSNDTYKGMIVANNYKSDAVAKIITDNEIEVINISTMVNNTTDDDYLIIMQRFIDDIRNLTLTD